MSLEDPPQNPPLTGQQRRYLRSQAHPKKPIVHVGEAGISASVISATDAALADHELVKIRLHQPDDKRAIARKLAETTGATLCGLVGHTVILYRRRAEEPRMEVPGFKEPSAAPARSNPPTSHADQSTRCR